jgi:hypothetical protein
MMVKHRKIGFSSPTGRLEDADRRASRRRRSQVVNEAPAEVQMREQARLAAEGYRFYAGESSEFAEASVGAVAEALEVDDAALRFSLGLR